MSVPKIEWVNTNKKTVYHSHIFSVQEIESTSPDGKNGSFLSLSAADWVITVPLTQDGELIMVRQWRHGSGKTSCEFPGGVLDLGEDPATAARRELLEETGYEARTITHLASLSPNPAIMSNTCHFYLAQDITHTTKQKLDPDEYIQVLTIKTHELLDVMGKGQFSHSLMVAACFLFLKHKNMISGHL